MISKGKQKWEKQPSIGQSRIDRNNPLNKELVAALAFNEGAGDKVKNLAGGPDAQIYTKGTSQFVNTPYGKGFRFDGVDCDTRLTLPKIVNGPYTISFWIKPAALTVSTLVAKGNSSATPWDVTMNASGRITITRRFTTTHCNVRYDNQLTVGVWKHVVAVWDGGTALENTQLYVNGKKQTLSFGDAATGTPRPDTTVQPVYIGGATTIDNFNGELTNVTIHNRAFTAKEARELYTNSNSIFAPQEVYSVTSAPLTTNTTSIQGKARIVAAPSSLAIYRTRNKNKYLTRPITIRPNIDWENPLSRSLFAAWPLNEGYASKAFEVTNSLPYGQITSATWTRTNKGRALDFTGGAADYVDVGGFYIPSNNMRMTLSCWIWADSFSAPRDDRFISKADGTGTANHDFMIGKTVNGADSVLRCRFGRTANTNIATDLILTTGRWHHCVAVFDFDGFSYISTIYLNGVRQSTPNFVHGTSLGTINNANRVYIGNQPTSTTNAPDGKIRDVTIWERVLSEKEVKSLYRNPNQIYNYDVEYTYAAPSTAVSGDTTNTTSITGRTRITNTASFSQTGKARLSRTEVTNIQGAARITKTTGVFQSGRARITNTAFVAQTGQARIQKAGELNQQGSARITNTVSISILGRSRITQLVSLTQTGKARVQNSGLINQSGIARIRQSADLNQTGKTRIQTTANISISGKAAIRNTSNLFQTGKASITAAGFSVGNVFIHGRGRIVATNSITQSGKARIQYTSAVNQTGRARIQQTGNLTQTGVARIHNTSSVFISGKANIAAAGFNTGHSFISGKARVQAQSLLTQTGKASIRNTSSIFIGGKANLTEAGFTSSRLFISGKASVFKAGNITIQSGIARIQKAGSLDISGKAMVRAQGVKNQSGVARITARSSTTQSGIARISKSGALNQQGIARIVQGASVFVSGVARIRATSTSTISGKASIHKTSQITQQGVANVILRQSLFIGGKATIANTSSITIGGKANINNPVERVYAIIMNFTESVGRTAHSTTTRARTFVAESNSKTSVNM